MSKNSLRTLEGTGWEDLRFWKYLYKYRGMREAILDRERLNPKIKVLPPEELWFRAFEYTPLNKVKCVILGQDPYHTPGVANGLAFSTMAGAKIPPSLRNIFKEYTEDLGYPMPRSGYLKKWADEGVLLLNTSLTVDSGKPGSHANLGWEQLTYEVLRVVSNRGVPTVFVFWGKHAAEYVGAVEQLPSNGCIVSGHPSPMAVSADVPFFGSKPFSRTNAFLDNSGVPSIDWRLY